MLIRKAKRNYCSRGNFGIKLKFRGKMFHLSGLGGKRMYNRIIKPEGLKKKFQKAFSR